jgi:hypothetical protein
VAGQNMKNTENSKTDKKGEDYFSFDWIFGNGITEK